MCYLQWRKTEEDILSSKDKRRFAGSLAEVSGEQYESGEALRQKLAELGKKKEELSFCFNIS